MLVAMSMMALADRNLEDREVDRIAEIFSEVTSCPIERNAVLEAAHTLEGHRADGLKTLAARRGEIDTAMKEQIIKACYLVLLADGVIAGEELKMLADTAAALGMPELHYKAVLETLED